MLLVLDNFETLWVGDVSHRDIHQILEIFAAVTTMTVVITMRGNSAPQIHQNTKLIKELPPSGLNSLSATAAKEMYIGLSRKALNEYDQKNSKALDTLLKEVDYIPTGYFFAFCSKQAI